MVAKILKTLIAVALLIVLIGCKADGLRKQADAFDSAADFGDRAATTIEQVWATADLASAWASDPVNQPLIDLLPAGVRLRIDQALASKEDVRPVLAEGVAAIRQTTGQYRLQADELRTVADREQSEWINLLAAVAAGLTGVGGLGALIGRVGGIAAGRRQGATEVAGVINVGRAADPAFDEHFNNGAGRVMAAELSRATPGVRDAVLATKITTTQKSGGAA